MEKHRKPKKAILSAVGRELSKEARGFMFYRSQLLLNRGKIMIGYISAFIETLAKAGLRTTVWLIQWTMKIHRRLILTLRRGFRV